MKLATVDYETAHSIVSKNHRLTWNGWNIVEWSKNPDGYYKKTGMFREGDWYITKTFPLESDGTWKVPSKYVAR